MIAGGLNSLTPSHYLFSSCDFIGRHRDLADHILSSHDLHHRPFTHYQTASIPFLRDQSYGTLNLIQAFNHDFIFYFYSNSRTRQMLFAIYLLGKRKTSNRFYYELKIQSPEEKFRQLKFTERCFSDEEISMDGEHLNPHIAQVLVVSQDTLVEHVKDEQIHFQYKISEIPKRPQPEVPVPMVKKKEKPKEKPKAKKDPKKTNLKRMESGIPNASESGGGPKKPSAEEEAAKNGLVPLTTSINRQTLNAQQKESPCLSPSINKNEKANAFNVSGFKLLKVEFFN